MRCWCGRVMRWRESPLAVPWTVGLTRSWWRLTLCGDLTGRLGDTLEELAGLPEDSVSPAQLSRWCWFHTCSVRLQDQIRRRVLEGETIPHEEKLFSLFEPHTRWIMKGKAGKPVEAGGSPDGAGRSASVHPGLALAVAGRRCGRGGSAGGGMPGTVSRVARLQFRPGVPQPRQPTATGRGAGARRVAREGARHGGQSSPGRYSIVRGAPAAASGRGIFSASCVKNLLQFLVGAGTCPYGQVPARREMFGRLMPPPAISRIPVRRREPRRSGHIDNAAPSATAHGSPSQGPGSDADRTPR